MAGSETSALSVRQPWAELIISGRKTIELRSWSTVYRGRLWIHAAGARDPITEGIFGYQDLFKGGFVGSVTLDHVLDLDPDRWERWRVRHLDQGPWRTDIHGWLLSDPIRFAEPIRASGKPGLFEPTTTQQERLLAEESRARGAR
jgi:hypothetical protein